MASSYKTPGVYVEEISKFPPSVAEVETAIPAFIGYTEKALIDGKNWSFGSYTDPISFTPAPAVKIESLLDFNTYFGNSHQPTIGTDGIIVDNLTKKVVSASINNLFYLYDSISLFYANGGGPCYIVSIGTFAHVPAQTDLKSFHFTSGLNVVKQEDEPTILLFPDAVSLDDSTASTPTLYSNMGVVMTEALNQCAALGDRVAIFDIQPTDELGTKFRDAAGMNNLKYGMAYTPWLKAKRSGVFGYSDVKSVLKDYNNSNASLALTDFIDGVNVGSIVANMDKAITDKGNIGTLFPTDIMGDYITLKNTYLNAKSVANSSSPPTSANADLLTATYNLLKNVYKLAGKIDIAAQNRGSIGVSSTTLQANIESKIDSTLRSVYSAIVLSEKSIGVTTNANLPSSMQTGGTNIYAPVYNAAANYSIVYTGTTSSFPTDTKWKDSGASATIFQSTTPTGTGLSASTKVSDVTDTIYNAINSGIATIVGAFSYITGQVNGTISSLEDALLTQSPTYSLLISTLENQLGAIPPSGAMAGLYAATDNERGVWKAPANISVSAVSGTTKKFTASELDGLNIDTTAGKSINAIRPIVGMSPAMVMGARTLAGNDNEWRYVPVRRFFNFVEESTKKSTAWAVFEPNDANLWHKVKAMIESFLYNLWRRGALAGAKPEQAYYVNCGLGVTMTADDILNGYLNVEIGMAAVRPAEFIVLKFSHKLQES